MPMDTELSCQLHKVLLKNKWNKNSTLVNVAETKEQYPICYTRLSHTPTGPSNRIGIRLNILQSAQHATHFCKETIGLCSTTDFQSSKTHTEVHQHKFLFPVSSASSPFHLLCDNSYIYVYIKNISEKLRG